VRRHTDDGSSGFIPSEGWCVQCDGEIRTVGCKWYGSNHRGPYCSTHCMRQDSNAGPLPDYVREFPPSDGEFTEEQITALRNAGEQIRRESGVPRAYFDGPLPSHPRDFELPRVPLNADLSIGDNWHGDEAR